MEQKRIGRTDGFIVEGEINVRESSVNSVDLQRNSTSVEENEIQPMPRFRRPSEPPPILCRTWVLFVSCFIGLPAGSIYSWSVLIDDVREAYPEWKYSCVPITVSFIFVGYGMMQFLFGTVQALRPMAFIASVFTGGGYFVCYLGLNKHHIYMFHIGGLVNGMGLGFARLAFVGFIKKWFFEYDKGLISSWVGTVSALGGALFAWVFRYHIDYVSINRDTERGLTQTFLWAAIIVGATQFWGALFMHFEEQKKLYGETPYDPMTFKEVLKTSQFWKILIVYITNLVPMIGIFSVFASRIRHYGDLSKVMAATYLAILCLVSAASRMCVRATAKAVGPKFLAGCLNLGGAATFLIIQYSLQTAPLVMTFIWIIIANACFSASFGLTEELCIKIYGYGSGPRVYWWVTIAIPIAGIIGPSVIAGKPDDWFRIYCYGSCGLLLFGLIVLCTVTKVIPRRGLAGSLI